MGRSAACILLFTFLLAACSPVAQTWRNRVEPLVNELERQGAPSLFPQEYHNLLETFEHGDAIYYVKSGDKSADIYYQFAFHKAELLNSKLRSLKQRLVEEERERALQVAARAEQDRLMQEALAAEKRLRDLDRLRAEATAKAILSSHKKPVPKEPPLQLLASYTVKRGETLPQIAGRAEIYNDSSLWPLIYRSNRDQIRDPRRLWPGQVLLIPRHFSQDDVLDARRYSGKK